MAGQIMRKFGTFEAKNRLSALLDLVEQGEEVVITRNGKPIARLSPATTADSDRQAKARKAAALIAKLSKGVTLGDHTIRELIDEGRL